MGTINIDAIERIFNTFDTAIPKNVQWKYHPDVPLEVRQFFTKFSKLSEKDKDDVLGWMIVDRIKDELREGMRG